MLGKFLWKNQGPALPKNVIEVVCPLCGAVQREPRRVVTTNCRKCGEHLRIEKQRAIASAQINPTPSPVATAGPPEDAVQQSTSVPGKIPQAPPPVADQPTALLPTGEQAAEADASLGLGHLMGLAPEEQEESTAARGHSRLKTMRGVAPPPIAPQLVAPELPLEEASHPVPEDSSAPEENEEAEQAPEVAPAPVAITPPEPEPVQPAPSTPIPASSTFQRMREQGIRQQYFKEAECFDCQHKFKVGRSAKATQCPSCGATVCMEDFDINMPSTQSIRTRGDVQIRKNGNVSTSEIVCRDLRLSGSMAAKVECTGDFIIRTSGNIIGEVKCKRLVVEKGSDLHFMNPIIAESVEVQSRISGNIECNGRVVITSTGWVQGDVTARSVSIEPGGQLDGSMNILRPPPPKPKPKTFPVPTGPGNSGSAPQS